MDKGMSWVPAGSRRDADHKQWGYCKQRR